MSPPRRWPAPWVFSLLILPLGMIVGLNYTALPFLLAKAGLTVDRIANLSSIINLPTVAGLILSPMVDVKLRRRTWLAIATFGTAIAACIYFPLIGASHVPPFGVDDFPLLLQPERTSAQTSEITAGVQNSALLCMAEPRPVDSW